MGIAFCKRKMFDEALDNFKEALRVKEIKLGDDDLEVASTLFQIGNVLENWEKSDIGIDYYEKSVRIRRQKLGEDDLLVAKT